MQKTGYRSFHKTEKVHFQDAHFKGLCRSRLTLTFNLSPWKRIWSYRMTFEFWLWIQTIVQWGSWHGINRIFRPPKCRKRGTGRFTKRQMYVSRTPISNEEACVVRVWPWPLTIHPGHEFGLFAWPLNFDLELKYWTVGFMTHHKSYIQAAEMQKTSYRSFTKRQNYVSRTPISKACVDRVWPWPLTFHTGHDFGLFAWPLNFNLE